MDHCVLSLSRAMDNGIVTQCTKRVSPSSWTTCKSVTYIVLPSSKLRSYRWGIQLLTWTSQSQTEIRLRLLTQVYDQSASTLHNVERFSFEFEIDYKSHSVIVVNLD